MFVHYLAKKNKNKNKKNDPFINYIGVRACCLISVNINVTDST